MIKRPKHYMLKISDKNYIETKDILDAYVEEAKQSPSISAWLFNLGKYYFRAFKKHDDPTVDLKKVIQTAVFVLEKLTNQKLNVKVENEAGVDILEVKK